MSQIVQKRRLTNVCQQAIAAYLATPEGQQAFGVVVSIHQPADCIISVHVRTAGQTRFYEVKVKEAVS